MKKFLRILLTFIAIIIAILVLLFLNNSGILATPPARDKIVSNELLFSDGVTKAYVLKEESYFSDFGEGTTRNVVCNLVIAKPDKQKIIKSLIRDNYFHGNSSQKKEAQGVTFNLKWDVQDTLIEYESFNERYGSDTVGEIRIFEGYLISEESYLDAKSIQTVELDQKLKQQLSCCGFDDEYLSTLKYKVFNEEDIKTDYRTVVNFDKDVVLVVEHVWNIREIFSLGPIIISREIVRVGRFHTSEWLFYDFDVFDLDYLRNKSNRAKYPREFISCKELYLHEDHYNRYPKKEWDKLDIKVTTVPVK